MYLAEQGWHFWNVLFSGCDDLIATQVETSISQDEYTCPACPEGSDDLSGVGLSCTGKDCFKQYALCLLLVELFMFLFLHKPGYIVISGDFNWRDVSLHLLIDRHLVICNRCYTFFFIKYTVFLRRLINIAGWYEATTMVFFVVVVVAVFQIPDSSHRQEWVASMRMPRRSVWTYRYLFQRLTSVTALREIHSGTSVIRSAGTRRTGTRASAGRDSSSTRTARAA